MRNGHTSTHAAEVAADPEFRRQVERLHSLGARATAEFLAEIGAERSIRTVIDQKLAVYAELDPKVIEAVEAAGFWPASCAEHHACDETLNPE